MVNYGQVELNEYMKRDWILDLLNDNMNPQERCIRTNKWLVEMDNKRMIYSDIYGDILMNDSEKKPSILDVGGGYNALTKILARKSNYYLLDFLAHGGAEYLKSRYDKERINWICEDWYNANLAEYDIVIANDIFPDVDMRLELFIEKMLPKCKEMRLLLTYYNEPRFYQMGRSDDPEILTFLSWDGEILGMKLKKYLSQMDATEEDLNGLKNYKESIYWNHRQVCYIKLRGYL